MLSNRDASHIKTLARLCAIENPNLPVHCYEAESRDEGVVAGLVVLLVPDLVANGAAPVHYYY